MKIDIDQSTRKVTLTLYHMEAAWLRELIMHAQENPEKTAESGVIDTTVIIREG